MFSTQGRLEPNQHGSELPYDYSAAVSLKRIADALDLQNKLAEATLKEVQRQANPLVHVYDPFDPE